MHAYKVGEPYLPGRMRWPETPLVRLTPQGCDLTLFYGSPTSAEIRDVKAGVASFAWVESERVAVLCYRLGSMPWSDAPFEVWRQRAEDRGALAGGPGAGLLLTVVLVDADTGVVRAIRAVTWPPAFADAVRATIARHLDAPPSERAAAAALQALYSRYDSASLALERADARC